MLLPSSAFFLLLLVAVNCQLRTPALFHEEEDAIRVQRRGHPAYRHHIRTVTGSSGGGGGEVGGGVMGEALKSGPMVEEEEEPSCEELRTIWRLTKRAAMQSLLSNEVPTYTAGAFGHILHAPEPSFGPEVGGKYAHGKKVFRPDLNRKKMANGLSARTAGSYERVEEELRKGMFAEKPYYYGGGAGGRGGKGPLGKSDVVYGVYSERGGVTEAKARPLQVVRQKNSREKQRLDKLARTMAKHAGSTLSTTSSSYNGNTMATHSSSCETLVGRRCDWSVDCTCYTSPPSGGGGGKLMYKCIRGKCTNAYSSPTNNNGGGGRDLPLVNKWHHYTSPTSGLSYYRSDYYPVDKEGWGSAGRGGGRYFRGQP